MILPRRERLGCIALGVVLALALTSGVASGQPRYTARDRLFNIQRFSQAIGAGRLITVEPAAAIGHLDFGLSYFVTWADRPLKLFGRSAEKQVWVDHLVAQSITVAFGLFDRFQLGIALPYTIAESCSESSVSPAASGTICRAEQDASLRSELFEGGGFNDLIVSLKGALFDVGGFGLALGVDLSVPIDDGGPFRGHNNLPAALDDAVRDDGDNRPPLTVTPRLMADYHARRFQIALNLGLRLQRSFEFLPEDDDLRVDHELLFGLGGSVALTRSLDGIVELWGATLADFSGSSLETPIEALLALRWRATDELSLIAGGGAALVRGYGAGRERLLAGLSYDFSVRVTDSDKDGIADRFDDCPRDAEDRDGFIDDDGCPDPDNDGDGVPDGEDACPFLFGRAKDGCERR